IAFITIILIKTTCFSQDLGTMIAANSGVYVRTHPSQDSEKLCSIKFGEMVEIMNEGRKEGIVDGMKGNWWKVKYNDCIGYVFDAYLANMKKSNEKFPKNYPQYFNLEAICGEERYFNSDFFWYGIFENDTKFKMRLVEVEFSIDKENWKGEEYDQYLDIRTNTESQPKFLIGLPDSIPDYEIKSCNFITNQYHLKESNRAYHIYPGQHFYIGNSEAVKNYSYYLESYGNVKEKRYSDSVNHHIPPFLRIEDYKIKIVEIGDQSIKSQDLLKDVERKVINESMPYIKFIGDLNFDSVPDILFYHLPEHSEADIYLFMSGYSEDEILTKVALNRWGNCH
ncbi:MAG: SH3 domain-containing protein, partial [Fulvivirga sp.]